MPKVFGCLCSVGLRGVGDVAADCQVNQVVLHEGLVMTLSEASDSNVGDLARFHASRS